MVHHCFAYVDDLLNDSFQGSYHWNVGNDFTICLTGSLQQFSTLWNWHVNELLHCAIVHALLWHDLYAFECFLRHSGTMTSMISPEFALAVHPQSSILGQHNLFQNSKSEFHCALSTSVSSITLSASSSVSFSPTFFSTCRTTLRGGSSRQTTQYCALGEHGSVVALRSSCLWSPAPQPCLSEDWCFGVLG